jgi:hypothetical protein
MLRWFVRITTGLVLGSFGALLLILFAIAVAMVSYIVWILFMGLG